MADEQDAAITLTTIVVADSRQVSAEMGDETLILHLDSGGYYKLSKVAARIWELLQNPVAVSEVAETLSREFATPVERCETDVFELLAGLTERGLLRIVSGDPA